MMVAALELTRRHPQPRLRSGVGGLYRGQKRASLRGHGRHKSMAAPLSVHSPQWPLRVRNRGSLRFRNVRFDEDCCPHPNFSEVPNVVRPSVAR
jgi:hypothetical protein